MTLRARNILRAVATGHAEVICGCEPHLMIDGLHICDQDTHELRELIAPAIPGQPGMKVLAILTDAGYDALSVG